jgi:hypothetical protein
LAVSWQANRDMVTFQVKPPFTRIRIANEKKCTHQHRKIVWPVAVFVALHYSSKDLTIQKIWTAGVEWDEQLPENRRVEWNDWINDFNYLSHFEIPRTFRLPKPTKSCLHTIFRCLQRCECRRVLSVSCLWVQWSLTCIAPNFLEEPCEEPLWKQ